MPIPLLTLLVACDAVKPELLDAELDSRDNQIEALEARIATLEASLETQSQALATEQAARVADIAALGQSIADGDAALDARVGALDVTVAAQGETLLSHDGALTTLAARADDHDAALDELDADLAALQVDTALLGLGLSAAETRLSLLESADIAGLETRVGALEDARAAAGETWSWFPSSESETYVQAWCSATSMASWHTVATVDFTTDVDGAVLVAFEGARAGSGGSSLPGVRLIIRDSGGREVAHETLAPVASTGRYLNVVWGAQVLHGVPYTAAFEVSDDCSAAPGSPTGYPDWVDGYAYGLTVTTL